MLWNERFLYLAEHVAGWSKDGSTQCGAVLVRPDKTIASLGFNGFPRGIHDDPLMLADTGTQARQMKLDRIIHAEMNALLFLSMPETDLTMYVYPMLPCHRCAVHIIQTGVQTVIARKGVLDRWQHSMDISRKLFAEAGVQVKEIENALHVVEGSGGGGSASDLPAQLILARGKRPDYDL